MIRYLLAGAALAAFVSPAEARDHSAYFGIEVGPMFARNSTVEDRSTGDRLFDINYKTGVDGDLIAGYDFGIIRAEWEGSHKWASDDNFRIAGAGSADGSGHTSAFTQMGNLMVDLGRNDTVNFYAGGGAGIAWIHERSAIHTLVGTTPVTFQSRIRGNEHFAWQAIAGVRAPVFRYFDIGLKYRYFNGGHFGDGDLRGEFRSHSVLASLIYNFAGEPARVMMPPPPPPPLPPPPPAPPATQTCPDGTVILATDVCPAPPPPPPPPEPTPERGN